MQYQLVLQFPLAEKTDIDQLLDQLGDLEEALDERLGELAEVDGHDLGVGEFNIFIHTNEPHEAFAIAKVMVEEFDWASQMAAAYRELTDDDYVRLWPTDLQSAFTVQ
jgi:hypothetical protein